MHKNLIKAQELFIEHMGEVCSLFEKDDEKGKIMASLYLSEKPLTKKELSDKLKLKPTKVEEVIVKAASKGILRGVTLKDSEELSYEISPNVVDVIMENVISKARKKFDMTLSAITECQELIAECENSLELSERVTAKLLYERLEKVYRLNRMGHKILKGFLLKELLDVDTRHLRKVKIK